MYSSPAGSPPFLLRRPCTLYARGAQAAYRAKIFRGIFQKCSAIHQGLPVLFGSSRKKFSGALHHLKECRNAFCSGGHAACKTLCGKALNEYSFGSGSRPPARAGKWCRCLYFNRWPIGIQSPPGAKIGGFLPFLRNFCRGDPQSKPGRPGRARAKPGKKRPGRGTEHLPGRESFS